MLLNFNTNNPFEKTLTYRLNTFIKINTPDHKTIKYNRRFIWIIFFLTYVLNVVLSYTRNPDLQYFTRRIF